MPAYSWRCVACEAANAASDESCTVCGCPSSPTYKQVEAAKKSQMEFSEQPSSSKYALQEKSAEKLKPHNYFIAILSIFLMAVMHWVDNGAKDGWSGLLHVLAYLLSIFAAFGVIAGLDSSAPGSQRNQPVLRSFLAAGILGSAAAVLNGSLGFIIFSAVAGFVSGLLGWRWIQHASL
jgi:hypothetical protein